MTPELREGFTLTLEKMLILGNYDPPSAALQSISASNTILKYDISGFEPGMIWLTGASPLFSMSGRSSASRRVLVKLHSLIGPEQPRALISLQGVELLHRYIAGEWQIRENLNDPLIEGQLDKGNFTEVLRALQYAGLISIETGDWTTCHGTLRMLAEVSERFDTDIGRNTRDLAIMRYYIKRRMVQEASDAVPAFMTFSARGSISKWSTVIGHLFCARVFLLQEEFDKAMAEQKSARSSLENLAGSLKGRRRAKTVFASGVLAAGMALNTIAAIAVERARQASAAGQLDRPTRGECIADIRMYLANARKFAPDLTEALKFLGSYWWHAGSRRRALSYWRQSIREGERLGAKVELGHTLVDAGALLGKVAPGPEWRKRGAELYAELGIRGV